MPILATFCFSNKCVHVVFKIHTLANEIFYTPIYFFQIKNRKHPVINTARPMINPCLFSNLNLFWFRQYHLRFAFIVRNLSIDTDGFVF